MENPEVLKEKSDLNKDQKLEQAARTNVEKVDRKMELMKRSHEQALVAYQIETMISERHFREKSLEDIVKCLQNLPENIRGRFRIIINNYVDQSEKTQDQAKSLVDYLETVKKMGVPVETTPEYIGQMIFRQRTGNEPNGKITFEQHEAYFIMICENEYDYALAAAGESDFARLQRLRMSGGTFHRSMEFSLADTKQTAPVLMIRGYQDFETTRKIIIHERQHFINDRLFANFARTEKTGFLESSAENSYRNIKDEVLAYIREGRSGEGIVNALSGELYAHLFSGLRDKEKLKVKELINKIKLNLDENRRYLESDESRAVLVYQLVGIPLERIPVWLNEFFACYGKREELSKLFPKLFDEFSDDHPLNNLIEDVFPSGGGAGGGYKQTVQNIEQLWSELRILKVSIDGIIFDISIDADVAKQLLEEKLPEYVYLRKQLNYQCDKLKQNGVVIPHAGITDLYKYRDEDGELGETPFTREVKQAVVDSIKDFPQKQIDIVEEYFNQKDKPKPASLRKLEKIIKDVVHKKNTSQKCVIGFRSDIVYKNSFRIFVNFAVDKEDKQRGIKEATFLLHLHSSKFSPFEAPSSDIMPKPSS